MTLQFQEICKIILKETLNRELNKIIACAATADANESLSYIFYYPVEGAL